MNATLCPDAVFDCIRAQSCEMWGSYLWKRYRSMVRAGLFGFNGILVGIGLAFFLCWDALLIVY
jgi:urea transporter